MPNDLQGRTALVTGANTGIGLVTARRLAEQGAQVFIACRTPARAKGALQAIRAAAPRAQVQVLALDLGDFASVRRCAAQFLALGQPLHLLVNNAGLGGQRGFTASGFELAFGTNHMGHFLLTQALLPALRAAATPERAARVVVLSSKMHKNASGIDWDAVRRPSRTLLATAEYAASKLANLLFAAELARREQDNHIHSYAVHPGVVASEIWRAVPWPIRPLMTRGMLTTEQGAECSLHCATATEAEHQSGLYYDRCAPRTPSPLGQDAALAAELWRRSEAWVAESA
jgi:NAD(P)-dependent dehydrogenase (short-subunit alcohol dehydrogenase family)